MTGDLTGAILERIEKDGVKFLRLQFADIQGQPKNVAIPVQQTEKALTEGISFDGSSVEGFARLEESDMVLRPDPVTYTILPWGVAESRVARLICDVTLPDGEPFEGDPRYILKQQLEKAAKSGYLFNTGPELEFFLFKMLDGKPTTQFQDHGGYFDLAPTDLAEDVRRDIVIALTAMGFEIEASHHEVAESQHEIDFKYGDALKTADNVITFKFVTKTLALMKGLHATFMAKPMAGINGNGMHINASLFKDGKNTFFDPDAPHQLSETAMHFIGGLLSHSQGITRVGNPTINSYKRMIPGYECPVYATWSTTNRSALIRVPAPRGRSTRIELRSPDTTCNPYLAFTVMLAAGMEGLKNKTAPPPSIDSNVFRLTDRERSADGITTLPRSLDEANESLLADRLLCDALGSHVIENLDRISRIECEAYRTEVHTWEIHRYLSTY